jgi:hypothetical protein
MTWNSAPGRTTYRINKKNPQKNGGAQNRNKLRKLASLFRQHLHQPPHEPQTGIFPSLLLMESQIPLNPRQLHQQPRHLPSLRQAQRKACNIPGRNPQRLTGSIKPPILTEPEPIPLPKPHRYMTKSRIPQKLLTRKAHSALTGTPPADGGLIGASDSPDFFIGKEAQQFRLVNTGSVDEIAEPLGTNEGVSYRDMRKQLGELLFSGYASRDFFLVMFRPRER